MELGDLIRVAQGAMDHGDYRGAAAACTHAIESFPSCLTAFRMLGEANLERGEIDLALEQFDRTLDLDPLNVVARLGMGVAYEEKKDYGGAYASYLHAWEINPALEQVRDELVRLRGVLRSEDRVHPTRPGLAGIHARSEQFGRAATEWRAILAAEPGSVRARTAMAEVLWRADDDVAAEAACKEALRATPENARALGMLADIEQRRGGGQAKELVERYQAVDPQGEVATILAEWRDELDLQFLRRAASTLPEFDLAQSAANASDVFAPSPIAPKVGLTPSHSGAPDLWDSLVQDLRGEGLPMPFDQPAYAASTAVEPFAWPDDGAAPTAVGDQDRRSSESDWLMVKPAASSINDDGDDLAALFAPSDSMSSPSAARAAETAPVVPEPVSQASAARAAAMDSAVRHETASGLKPIADPFVTADGRVDLTVGWDDLDRKLREATPSFDGGHEYDSLLAELGVDGIAPFVAEAGTFDAGAWAPFTDDDLAAGSPSSFDEQPPIAAAAPPVFHVEHAPVQNDLAAYFSSDGANLAADGGDAEPQNGVWRGVDDDLLATIPVASASGYTELLRHVDIDDSVDFDASAQNGVDPFAGPDAYGQPLGFDDLLAVTSQDGTAPLREAPDVDSLEESPSGNLHAMDGIDIDPQSLEAASAGVDAFEPIASVRTVADSAAHQPSPVAGAGEGAFADLEQAFGNRDDLRPFSLEDIGQPDGPASAETMDFSEIDDPMYRPQKYAAPSPAENPSEAIAWNLNVGPKAGAEAPAIEDGAVVETLRSEIAAGKIAGTGPTDPASAPSVGVGDLAGSKEGATEGVVVWPSFVNHSSELIDRQVTSESLFDRLRRGKRAAIDSGGTSVDCSISAFRNSAPAGARDAWTAPTGGFAAEADVVPDLPPAPSTLIPIFDGEADKGEANRAGLMSLRIRLIEDDSAALEISQVLESSIGLGQTGTDPLALRVLGEAYLKLGRPEQAAAQFRQAMLARRGGR